MFLPAARVVQDSVVRRRSASCDRFVGNIPPHLKEELVDLTGSKEKESKWIWFRGYLQETSRIYSELSSPSMQPLAQVELVL